MIPKKTICLGIPVLVLLLVAPIFETLSTIFISWVIVGAGSPSALVETPLFLTVGSFLKLDTSPTGLLSLTHYALIAVILSFIVVSASDFFSSIFSAKLSADVSNSLYENSLSMTWLQHSEINHSKLIKDITIESERISQGIIYSSLQLFSRGIFVLCAGAIIIYSEPILAVSLVTIFGLSYLVIFIMAKPTLLRLGQTMTNSYAERQKHLSVSYFSIKEIIIGNMHGYFQSRFNNQNLNLSRARGYSRAIKLLPRHFVELIFFVSIIAGFILLLTSGTNIADKAPTLILIAVIGAKLLSSINQIYNLIATIYPNIPALESLNRWASKPPLPDLGQVVVAKTIPFKHRISFRNVCFKYETNAQFELKNICIDLQKNSITGLFGESGSGKSTITELMMGLYSPSSGSIFVDNKILNSETTISWQSKIAFVSQDFHIIDGTLLENITFGTKQYDQDPKDIAKALELSGLSETVSKFPKGLNTRIGEHGRLISGGQRQRIAFARALLSKKEILILDEPTSALDERASAKIIETLTTLKNHVTIVIISHSKETKKVCDKIILVTEGRAKLSFDAFQKSK